MSHDSQTRLTASEHDWQTFPSGYVRCENCYAIRDVDQWPCPGWLPRHEVVAFVKRMRGHEEPHHVSEIVPQVLLDLEERTRGEEDHAARVRRATADYLERKGQA